MAPANVVGDGAPLVIKSYNLDSGSGANALGEKPLEIYLFGADLEGLRLTRPPYGLRPHRHHELT